MKVIGSDFDGTILINRVILDSTRELINEFRNQGNLFVIVTGRSPRKINDGIIKYNVDFYDYIICSNGSLVYDKDLNIVNSKFMNIDDVNMILNALKTNTSYKRAIVNLENESIDIDEFDDLNVMENPILSFSLEFNSIEERRNWKTSGLENSEIFSNNVYTDILPKGVSKATSLMNLYKQLEGTKLFTIGDGENDVCMFKLPCESYTFSTCDEVVKKEAGNVCDTIDDVLRLILLK